VEHVKRDSGAPQACVGELLRPLRPHPQPVLEDHVGAVLEQGEGVAVEQQLQPPVEAGVLVRHAELGLPVVGADPHVPAVSFETLREGRLPRAGQTTEQVNVGIRCADTGRTEQG
jgi:hypothetical protein